MAQGQLCSRGLGVVRGYLQGCPVGLAKGQGSRPPLSMGKSSELSCIPYLVSPCPGRFRLVKDFMV